MGKKLFLNFFLYITKLLMLQIKPSELIDNSISFGQFKGSFLIENFRAFGPSRMRIVPAGYFLKNGNG